MWQSAGLSRMYTVGHANVFVCEGKYGRAVCRVDARYDYSFPVVGCLSATMSLKKEKPEGLSSIDDADSK